MLNSNQENNNFKYLPVVTNSINPNSNMIELEKMMKNHSLNNMSLRQKNNILDEMNRQKSLLNYGQKDINNDTNSLYSNTSSLSGYNNSNYVNFSSCSNYNENSDLISPNITGLPERQIKKTITVLPSQNESKNLYANTKTIPKSFNLIKDNNLNYFNEPLDIRSISQLSYNSNKPVSNIYSNPKPSVSTAVAGSRQPINIADTNIINEDLNNFSMNTSVNSSINDLDQYNKIAEVDYFTDLLVKGMEDSTDPDFFGTCYKCGKTIYGDGNGCSALGQLYHINCFNCYVCNKTLEGTTFYPVEGKPYCKLDYLNTLEKCYVCHEPILDRILRAMGNPYHPNCFYCVVCGKCLDGIHFTVDYKNRTYCIEDFYKKFAPKCCVCETPIMPEKGQQKTVRIVALDRCFHIKCYKCEDCGVQLSSEKDGKGCFPLDNHILCKGCNNIRFQKLLDTTKVE